jgi:hypothetical protein
MLRAKDVTNYRRSKFENSIFSGFSSVDLTLQRLLMLFSKLFKKSLSSIFEATCGRGRVIFAWPGREIVGAAQSFAQWR